MTANYLLHWQGFGSERWAGLPREVQFVCWRQGGVEGRLGQCVSQAWLWADKKPSWSLLRRSSVEAQSALAMVWIVVMRGPFNVLIKPNIVRIDVSERSVPTQPAHTCVHARPKLPIVLALQQPQHWINVSLLRQPAASSEDSETACSPCSRSCRAESLDQCQISRASLAQNMSLSMGQQFHQRWGV